MTKHRGQKLYEYEKLRKKIRKIIRKSEITSSAMEKKSLTE
jgi:hypothetical protein